MMKVRCHYKHTAVIEMILHRELNVDIGLGWTVNLPSISVRALLLGVFPGIFLRQYHTHVIDSDTLYGRFRLFFLMLSSVSYHSAENIFLL